MTSEAAGVDERVFRNDLAGGPFQSGADRGRWRLIAIVWPHVLIAVSAAERPTGPSDYVFRFDCANYPQHPPTAQPWDLESNQPLPADRWPGGRDRVSYAFNPGWKNGTCLYLPCDRLSIEGHDAWRQQHPSMIWSPTSDITFYLRIIHELLNSNAYSGIRSA